MVTVTCGAHTRNMDDWRCVVTTMVDASEKISREVGSWDGITSRPHRFGGVEFRFGRVELGHMHGDSLADLPFPKATRDSFIASGRAEPHHVLPDTGWLSRRMRSDSDVDDVIRLFRVNYERIAKRRSGRRTERPGLRQRTLASGDRIDDRFLG